MTKILEITTTTENGEEAKSLARTLVEERLAACVQISAPLLSVYRWRGKVCETQEYRCTLKSVDRLLPALLARIEELHSYDVPEILVSEVDHCSASYQAWLLEQVAAE